MALRAEGGQSKRQRTPALYLLHILATCNPTSRKQTAQSFAVLGVLQPHRQRVPNSAGRICNQLWQIENNTLRCKAWQTRQLGAQVSFQCVLVRRVKHSSQRNSTNPALNTKANTLHTAVVPFRSDSLAGGARIVVAADFLQQNAEPEPSLDTGQPREPWIRRSFRSCRRSSTSAAR